MGFSVDGYALTLAPLEMPAVVLKVLASVFKGKRLIAVDGAEYFCLVSRVNTVKVAAKNAAGYVMQSAFINIAVDYLVISVFNCATSS